MTPGTSFAPVWRHEWRLALRRRRLLALNVAIPLLLVLPLVLGGAPVSHAAAALVVLFVFFGTFGSAIPLLRDGEEGTLRRVLLAGAPAHRILLERVAAGAVLDLLQLAPSVVALVLAWHTGPTVGALLFLVLGLTLVVTGFLGAWIAAAARSVAEGALFGAVVALLLLHGSGVFRTAAPGSTGALFERLLPFGPLHEVLLAAGGAGFAVGGAGFEAGGTGLAAVGGGVAAWGGGIAGGALAAGGGGILSTMVWTIGLPAAAGLGLALVTALLARPLLDRVAPALR